MKKEFYINMFLVALTFFHDISSFEVWNQKTQLNALIKKKEISMICGSPKILYCDKGSEFQGILLLTYCLHLLTLQRLCPYIVKLFFV